MSDTDIENQLRIAKNELNRRIASLEQTLREKESAEEALQESEKRYRRLFESAKDGILILDADTGKVVDVNPFLLQLLAYSYDAIWGQHIWELGVFKDIAESKDAFKTLQDNEYIRYNDLPLETLDGRPIAVEFVSNVYLVDHRKVIQCNIRDITGRKRADQRLRDLGAIEESSDDAIISMTLEGRILTWNKAAERIYGYTAEEIVGQSVSILVPQDRPDELSEILAKLKSGETVTHYETVRVRKDGECIHVSLAISPLKDAKARTVGAATIARDITKRKRMEDELRKSHDELGMLFRDLREKSENLEEVNNAESILMRIRESFNLL
jgi:PAS domain S-box-containing protein